MELPTMPLAPGRLSMITGTPQRSFSGCDTRRAMKSSPPPGA
jgi:hypothetical protein